jgi:sulfite exporter TauE/SafE
MALTVSARSRFQGPSTPSLIKGAALCSAFGIGSSLTEYADYGKWLTVAGVLLLIAGLHRFGRMGPDPAILFELPAPRKKKKKRKLAGSEAEPSVRPAEAESESEP